MTEQIAQANGIEIAYETFGDPERPAILLVMGLGVQMLGWPDEFCELLADRGFHVIRFDNRDVGRSTKIEGGPPPDLAAAMMTGDASSASYTLDDMANDAFGLLDHLGIEAAHVVGISMGGMIGQTMAIGRPERVLSLTSIMSTTGDRAVGQPLAEVLPVLVTPAPADRPGFVDHAVSMWRVIASPGFPFDEERIRLLAGASYERSYHPAGFGRQLLAIAASGDRTEALGAVRVPTLVIHGKEDPLITVSGGEATARAIPDAELMVIPGMGHDLPLALWPQVIDAIVQNTARAASPSEIA